MLMSSGCQVPRKGMTSLRGHYNPRPSIWKCGGPLGNVVDDWKTCDRMTYSYRTHGNGAGCFVDHARLAYYVVSYCLLLTNFRHFCGALLLTLITFNPSLDKSLHSLQSVGEIAYPFPYSNGAVVDVSKWIYSFISHLTEHAMADLWWNQN